MAHRHLSNPGRLSLSAHAIAAMVVAASLAGLGINTWAQERATARSSLAATELERAFWICDHAATTRGVGGSSAITCSVITEDLKARKFSGDFSAMLAWWRLNKATEHQALETTSRAGPRPDAFSQR